MNLKISFYIASMLLVAAPIASSQDEPLMQPFEDMGPQLRLLNQLKLSEDQKKEVQKLRFDLEKQLVAQRAKLQTAGIELRQLLQADNPDRAAIEKKMNEMVQLGLQSGSLLLNQWFAVNKLLNADQQKVWRQMLTRAAEVMGHGFRGMQMMRQRFGQMGMRRFGPGMRGPGPEMHRPEPPPKMDQPK